VKELINFRSTLISIRILFFMSGHFFPRLFSKSRSVRKKKKKKKGLREECERNNVVPDAKILGTKK